METLEDKPVQTVGQLIEKLKPRVEICLYWHDDTYSHQITLDVRTLLENRLLGPLLDLRIGWYRPHEFRLDLFLEEPFGKLNGKVED